MRSETENPTYVYYTGRVNSIHIYRSSAEQVYAKRINQLCELIYWIYKYKPDSYEIQTFEFDISKSYLDIHKLYFTPSLFYFKILFIFII